MTVLEITDLTNDQLRQYINAEQNFNAFEKICLARKSYRGSLFWQTKNEIDYLIKESAGKILPSKCLGKKSDETIHVYNSFVKNKDITDQRYKALNEVMLKNKRLNVALRVGRVPHTVVSILNSLEKSNMAEHFLVIGTNALYAYEAGTGTRFESDILATEDIDLLWDSRKRLQLVGDDLFNTEGVIGLLRKADKTFEITEDGFSAINKNGYSVDIIKRRPKSFFDDKEPQKLIPSIEDLFAQKITDADWILSSKKYTQMVIAENGEMARMTTINPINFVIYKAWLSQQEERNPLKKPRDKAQALAVYNLIEQRLPQLKLDDAHTFPVRVRNIIIDLLECEPPKEQNCFR